jgi:hypothetical protein
MTGLRKCGNIYRIINLTPVAHISCNREDHSRYKYKRAFRTNSNLAALREFYLKNFHIEVLERISSHENSSSSFLQSQLHIIDAIDIIWPRLIDTNHFLCNCQNFFYEIPAGRECYQP